MPNEVDNFLGGLDNKEVSPFEQDKKDPLNDAKEEVKKEDEEEKIPFHKDPKVQSFIEREIDKRMRDVPVRETIIREERQSDEVDPMTDVLTRIIGNDTPAKVSAIKDFQRALESREDNIREEALREIESRSNEEHEAEVDAQNELISGFEDIEDSFGVDLRSSSKQAQALRSEFVDFIQRIAPKDEYGQVTEFPDLEQTFELFQETKKADTPTNNRAKELAARSSRSTTDAAAVPTSTDKSWRGVEKWLSKLSG